MNDTTPFTGTTRMSVSGLLHRKGTDALSICVMIEDGEKAVEIRMPEASVLSNNGYTEAEIKDMIAYLEQNYEDIQKTAKGINPMAAFMK